MEKLILKINNPEFREKIKENKNLINDYSVQEIKEIKKKQMPKILFNHNAKRTSKRIIDDEGYVTCEICSGKYTPKNGTAHRKTQKHILLAKLNTKMRDLIINDK